MPTIHVLGNLLLIITLGVLGWGLSRRAGWAIVGIGLSGMLALSAVLLAVRPDLIVKVLPFRDLTFYQNLYPAAVVLFVPCAWRFVGSRSQRVRMTVWCALLFVMSFQPFNYPLAAQARSGGTFIDGDGVCMQSNDYTCSAASVVTLMRTYGVEVSEADAIDWARTKREKGTQSLGLYRALRHYADQVGGRDAVIGHVTLETLLERTEPAIVLVGLPSHGRSVAAAAFGRDNNWPVGVYHDVVFMGMDPDHPDRVLIADPDMGLESWPAEHMRYLFRGVAVMYR
ncbi:MAG: hypothetical protein R3C45_17370 [Phycisphaerales bacterium]